MLCFADGETIFEATQVELVRVNGDTDGYRGRAPCFLAEPLPAPGERPPDRARIDAAKRSAR